jgi:pectinesterase
MVYEMDEEKQERFPVWLSKSDRRLLQADKVVALGSWDDNNNNSNNVKPNSVVALDGSGDFISIQAAVNNAPPNSTVRHVIYIKKGIYDEQIRVPGNKTWLAFVGDGAGKTIITGNISTRMDNVTTKSTATVSKLAAFLCFRNPIIPQSIV